MLRRDFPSAVEWAEKAVAADPFDQWSLFDLSGVLIEMGELDRAAEIAQDALKLSPRAA